MQFVWELEFAPLFKLKGSAVPKGKILIYP